MAGQIHRRVLLVDENGDAYTATGGGGPGTNVVVTDIEDGAGDSVMDATNDAIRVNVVAGGTGGGAVTIADGDDEALGATGDAAASSDTGTFSLIALIKRLLQKLTTQLPAALTGSGNLKVSLEESNAAQPVTDNGGSLTVDGSVSLGAALPAGTNNIGDVDVLTLPAIPAGNNNIGDVDVASHPAGSVAGTTATTKDYDTGAGTDTVLGVGFLLPASGGSVAGGTSTNPMRVDPTGTTTQPVSGTVTANAGTGTRAVAGDVAHDGVDSGNPVKLGAKAIAHGANPTAVAANDRTDLYANRHGVQFVIGGHPNTIVRRDNFTAAQTDTALVTVSSGTKIVVTRVLVTLDKATSVNVMCRVGFGTANTPTGAGCIAGHPGLDPGGGFATGDGSGILGVGADDEDLRFTCTVPTSGSISIFVSYYLIES